MDWIWWIVTGAFLVVVFGGWWLLAHRGHLLTRADHTDPETARQLREVQRQIDLGNDYHPGGR